MEYWNSGMPYFIPHLNKAYVYPDTAQAVSVSSQSHEWAIKAIQSDRLSSGMQEVVGKAARVEHIFGKTLGIREHLTYLTSSIITSLIQSPFKREIAV